MKSRGCLACEEDWKTSTIETTSYNKKWNKVANMLTTSQVPINKKNLANRWGNYDEMICEDCFKMFSSRDRVLGPTIRT